MKAPEGNTELLETFAPTVRIVSQVAAYWIEQPKFGSANQWLHGVNDVHLDKSKEISTSMHALVCRDTRVILLFVFQSNVSAVHIKQVARKPKHKRNGSSVGDPVEVEEVNG